MSERKAVIKNADMSEEMQQDAVDCATQALEKYNIEKVCVCMEELVSASVGFVGHHVCNVLKFFYRILQHISKRSLTRNTIRRGIVLWDVTSAAMLPTRPGTLSTSTWARWQSSCSKAGR